MFKIKNVAYLITLYCAALTCGEPKYESTLFERLPTELQVNIAARLPETELNKMSLISKALYNANYFVLEEHRRRAFHNYLLYPFLSSFYEEPVFRGSQETVQYRGTEERDTLSILLKNNNDKSFFYSLLLREAHRDYFKSNNWIKFFNLRTKSYFKGRVTQIKPRSKERELHQEINKVFIIRINGKELLENRPPYTFDDIVNGCADTIYNNMYTKTADSVRIVIDDTDAISHNDIFFDLHTLILKFSFVKLLLSKITEHDEKNKTSKITFIKTLDLTTYDNIPWMWEDPSINFTIQSIPESIQLQVNYSPELFLKKMNGELKNIIFRPSSFVPVTGLIHGQFMRDENLVNIDNLELLCENGFALSLIGNIGNWMLVDQNLFEQDQQVIRILSHYISPFTRNIHGLTLLDLLFFASLKPDIPEEQARKIIALFFSIAGEAGINLNKYIIIKDATTPLQSALMNLKKITQGAPLEAPLKAVRIANFILQFAQRGIDLSSEFNNRVMRTFFEEMYLFEPSTQILMFDSLTDNEIVPSNGQNVFQRITEDGNTLLHIYFKHAMVFTVVIILKILNRLPNDMINAKNNSGESIFECFIRFIQRYLQNIRLGKILINNPFQIPGTIISVVKLLLNKKFDLTQLTSTGQTYVAFLEELIKEDREMRGDISAVRSFPGQIVSISLNDFSTVAQKILDIIRPLQGNIDIIIPLQGKIKKRKGRW